MGWMLKKARSRSCRPGVDGWGTGSGLGAYFSLYAGVVVVW